MLSPEQGKKLVKLARQSISSHIDKESMDFKENIKKEFSMLRGVFVTLDERGLLRGCIGIVEAVYPLYEAVASAAVSAAFSDPRFTSLSKQELDRITISVSVLTSPKMINVDEANDYLKQIEVGKDGLLIKGEVNSGLLLPIVAVEQKWDSLVFLEQTCMKAGLAADSWKELSNCKVYKFQTEVFSEETPDGEIVKKM